MVWHYNPKSALGSNASEELWDQMSLATYTNTQAHRKPVCTSTRGENLRWLNCQRAGLSLSSVRFSEILLVPTPYTSVHVHAHRNRASFYPVKSNPYLHLPWTHLQIQIRATHACTSWPVVSDWYVFWHRVSEIAPHAQWYTAPHKATLCVGCQFPVCYYKCSGYQVEGKLYFPCCTSRDLLVWRSWWVILFSISLQ